MIHNKRQDRVKSRLWLIVWIVICFACFYVATDQL
jgi:hypothetical protein